MRLRTVADSPDALWLPFMTAQAVLRPSPSTAACSSIERYPSDINAVRISLILAHCLDFSSVTVLLDEMDLSCPHSCGLLLWWCNSSIPRLSRSNSSRSYTSALRIALIVAIHRDHS